MPADSDMVMVPPVGEALTAESVKLLRKGDRLQHVVFPDIVRSLRRTSGEWPDLWLHFEEERDSATLCDRFTFLSRPTPAATSTADQVERLCPCGKPSLPTAGVCSGCADACAADGGEGEAPVAFASVEARAEATASPEALKRIEEDPAEAFLAEVRAELARARAKFPGDRIMTLALAEEFGELCKAVLDESAANVRKEAVQTAVMAARVALDGDGSVTSWRAERGLDPLAGATPAPAVPAGVTHYGLFRPSVPNSPMIKEAAFFAEEGGLTEPWGQSWEPIRGAVSSGEARRMFAQAHGVTLSNIYDGEA